MSKKETFNVLSIDGGGIRGIIPAMILAEIEDRIEKETGEKKRISCLFDLVVGTSTGGILALGLTQEGTPEKPQLSAAQLVEIYENHGSTIFDKLWLEDFLSKAEAELRSSRYLQSKIRKVLTTFASHGQKALSVINKLADEKYSREGLEKVFNCYIDEELTLRDVTTDTMIPCYDMQTPEALFLKSWKEKYQSIKIKDAAFATSAAPTFFEPLPLCIAGEKQNRTLIDGGIFINSPVVSAYAEAKKRKCKENIFVASLGTGVFASSSEYSEAKDWGAARWLLALFDYVSHSGPAAAHYQMKQLLDSNNYVRLQTELNEDHDEMDDPSDDNIRYLKRQAKNLIDSCEFKKLYCQLKKRVDEVCE